MKTAYKQTPVGKIMESMQGDPQPVRALYNPTVELLKHDAIGIKRSLLAYAELLTEACTCKGKGYCVYCGDAAVLQGSIENIQNVVG